METIKVINAKRYFLKNICVDIPKNKSIAVTGVSGSGKSTFAYDILFTEGSSRYINALNNNSTVFADFNKNKDFDFIDGLLPAMALKQNLVNNANPRSTIATLTTLSDYFRTLFKEVSVRACKKCSALNKASESLCHSCGEVLQTISDKVFSFNTDEGMCSTCHGLGHKHDFDKSRIIPEPWKPINQQPWGSDYHILFHPIKYYYNDLAKTNNFNPDTPFNELSDLLIDLILYGIGNNKVEIYNADGTFQNYITFTGIIEFLRRIYQTHKNENTLRKVEKYMSDIDCHKCNGTRFNDLAKSCTINGKNIADYYDMNLSALLESISTLITQYNENDIVKYTLKQIYVQVSFICELGLSYLKLNRQISTLSKGELQHIRLSDHLGTNLSGVLYILDEPTSGLHISNISVINKAIERLKNNGNTVMVIEHNFEVIKNVDYILDFGPGGGKHGGEVCYFGPTSNFDTAENSLTAKYLTGKMKIECATERRKANTFITINDVNINNLHHINAAIPLNLMVAVAGVSGSGKSSFVIDILYNELMKQLKGINPHIQYTARLSGYESIQDIVAIDATPIGRMKRSNVATYVGIFDNIRKIYADTQEAIDKGFTASMFSFNSANGRCETCEGLGIIPKHIYFSEDIMIECPKCGGKRYRNEILTITWKGKNISDVLDMTVEEALEHFREKTSIKEVLELLHSIGIGYLTLGQISTSLSGGEAQRIKLTKHLARKNVHNTIFLLDEPTAGLHSHDIVKLLNMLHELVDKGNSVVFIEHNMDAIKTADYVIIFGLEDSTNDAKIIIEGTPEEVIANSDDPTTQYLRKIM